MLNPQGKASVIWRAIHSAVGLFVTPIQTSCVYRKLCMDGARGAREKLTISEAFGCGHVFGL